MSHEGDVFDVAHEDAAARRHLKVVERVTGWKPTTCPWRAMYHPLVRDVMSVLPALELQGMAAVALPPNTPHIFIEAIAEYRRALEATRHDDHRLRLEEAKRAREAQR